MQQRLHLVREAHIYSLPSFFLGVYMGNYTIILPHRFQRETGRGITRSSQICRGVLSLSDIPLSNVMVSQGPGQSLIDSRGIWIRLWAPTRGAPTLGCSEVTVSTQLCTPQTTGVPAADSITRIRRVFSAFSGRCITGWGRSYVAENLCPQGQDMFCGFRRGTGQAQGLPLPEVEARDGEESL